MGGQASVFYGAAQVSKDVDFTICADEENSARLDAALAELQAEQILARAYWEPLRKELEEFRRAERG